MSPAAENYIRGAEMAKQLAEEYRRDAERQDTPATLREKWLSDAQRAEERAEWYSAHARMTQ